MRKLLALLALSVVAAPLASADQSIAINARGGAAKPWGDSSKGSAMTDSVAWAFPLQGDLAFRFTKNIGVGAYIRYAPTMLADNLDSACKAAGGSCSATDLGFGGLVEYRFGERLDGGGWLGLSLGYEMAKTKTAATGGTATVTLSGFEGGVQAGYDFTLAALTIGPFVHANVGQFSKLEAPGQSGSITDKAFHGFFGLGIRVGILL
ncbi:MAG: autotransporter domain-containing protein [Deltaproteobacteria bacterium]|nr:autotransporter domain-containing protein [Deltaproteobacteria bacterium]